MALALADRSKVPRRHLQSRMSRFGDLASRLRIQPRLVQHLDPRRQRSFLPFARRVDLSLASLQHPGIPGDCCPWPPPAA
jgi:hypothetical protein